MTWSFKWLKNLWKWISGKFHVHWHGFPLIFMNSYAPDEQTTEIGILPANFCISHHADWTNAVKSYIKEIGITGGEMDDMWGGTDWSKAGRTCYGIATTGKHPGCRMFGKLYLDKHRYVDIKITFCINWNCLIFFMWNSKEIKGEGRRNGNRYD